MFIALAILLLLVLSFLVYASACISSGIYLKALCKIETRQKTVILTFDDGPDPVQTPKILDLLKQYNVQACFFCIGNRIEGNEYLLQRMMDEGHLTGLHSFYHRWNFPLQSTAKVENELLHTQAAILAATGITASLFRPPFGVINPLIARAVKRLHLKTVGWSVRSLDTKYGSEKALQRIKKQIAPGSIILLHDDLPSSHILLENLLQFLLYNGYTVAPLNENLKT